jgi:uncharacterized protein (TIGR00304 family)
MDPAALRALGIMLIIFGVFIIVIAIILTLVWGSKNSKTKGGGAIIIGPIPIIFGGDKKSLKTFLPLSLALTLILVVAMIIYYLLLR